MKGNQVIRISGKKIEKFLRVELGEISQETLDEAKQNADNTEKLNIESRNKKAYQKSDYLLREIRNLEFQQLKEQHAKE